MTDIENKSLRAAPTPDAHSEVGVKALEWAMDEIDALSNKLCGFAYPQGMAMTNRAGQQPSYIRAVEARAALKADTAGVVKAEPVARPANFSGWKERLTDLSNEVGEVVGPDPDKALDRVQAIIAEMLEGFDDVIEEEAALASKPEGER